MPRAIPVAVRQLIWQRHQQGEATTALAAAYGASGRAIRALLRRLHSAGLDAIRPDYHAPPPPPHAKPAACRAEVIQLRRDHPTWGAAWLLTVLRQRFPDRPWPAPRTAQRWLKAAGLNPAPRGRRPGLNPNRATAPHEVWQMDGAECIRLASGEQVCWLRVVDEFTGAALQTTIFPPAPAVSGRRAAGPRGLAPGLHAVGSARPVPRGQRSAVGVGRRSPPEVACWLIGLGIEMIWNPPRRPQANGVIERSQGVEKNWAEPWTCADAAELQRRVDETDRLQREAYAGPGEQPRWQEFPALAHSGRQYRPGGEDDLWDLEIVKNHLAQYVVRRKVDPLGKVSIYNRPRPVSRAWVGKVVNVGFDAEECGWVVTADDGQELRRMEAPEVSREAVMGLRMCYRHPSRPAPCVDPVGREGEVAHR